MTIGAIAATVSTGRLNIQPSVVYGQKPRVTGDFRMGRTQDGKWILGNDEYDTQEEMLSALQDILDEMYGPDSDDMLGDGIFGPRKWP